MENTKRRFFERVFILATVVLGIVAAYISIGFIVRGTEMANNDPVIRELATYRGIMFCIAASLLAFIGKVMSGTRWTFGRAMLTIFLGLLAGYNFLSIIVVQVTAAEANNTQALAGAKVQAELETQLNIYQEQAGRLTENAGGLKSTTGKEPTRQEELYGRTLASKAAARAAVAASEAAAVKRQLDAVRATSHGGTTFATALCKTTDKVAGDPNCAKASYWQYGYEIVGGMILDLISIVCFGWAGSLLRREIDHETQQAVASGGWFGRLLRSAGKRMRMGAVAAGVGAAAATGGANAHVPPTVVPATSPAPAPTAAPVTAPAPAPAEHGSAPVTAPVPAPAEHGSAPVTAPAPAPVEHGSAPVTAPAPAPVEHGSAPVTAPVPAPERLADQVAELGEARAEEVLLLTGYRWRMVAGAIASGACTPSERNVRDLAACNRDTAVTWLSDLVAQGMIRTERVGESGALRYKLNTINTTT